MTICSSCAACYEWDATFPWNRHSFSLGQWNGFPYTFSLKIQSRVDYHMHIQCSALNSKNNSLACVQSRSLYYHSSFVHYNNFTLSLENANKRFEILLWRLQCHTGSIQILCICKMPQAQNSSDTQMFQSGPLLLSKFRVQSRKKWSPYKRHRGLWKKITQLRWLLKFEHCIQLSADSTKPFSSKLNSLWTTWQTC